MILRPAHIELTVKNLEESIYFYVTLLGFSETFREENKVYLRAAEEFDTYSLVLTQAEQASLNGFAFRVSSSDFLDELEQKHIDMKVEHRSFIRNGEKVLRVIIPSGHPVEFVHQKEELNLLDEDGIITSLPMRHAHKITGVPPLFFHHVNIHVPDVEETLNYWLNLEFGISEYVVQDNGSKFGAWVRRSASTHDIAIVQSKTNEAKLHHFSYIVEGITGVIRTCDILADAGYSKNIEFGPGRHGGTNAFFLYIKDPDGHRLEIFSSDYRRDLDRPPLKWSMKKFLEKGRLSWGTHFPDTFYTDYTEIDSNGWLGETVKK